jgi:Tfp pilus assembly protein PilE
MNHSKRQQRGMTFLGLLCILVLVGLVVYAGIRLVPVYLNYMKIARTMESTAKEVQGENPDAGAIRRILERHWAIEDPTSLEVKDIEITRDNNGISIHAAYDDSAPYLGNVSLTAHFDKTVKVR